MLNLLAGGVFAVWEHTVRHSFWWTTGVCDSIVTQGVHPNCHHCLQLLVASLSGAAPSRPSICAHHIAAQAHGLTPAAFAIASHRPPMGERGKGTCPKCRCTQQWMYVVDIFGKPGVEGHQCHGCSAEIEESDWPKFAPLVRKCLTAQM